MKARAVCLVSISLFCIVFISLVVFSPFLLNTEVVKKSIFSLVEKNTGVLIPFRDCSLDLFMDQGHPCLGIVFEDLEITCLPRIRVFVGRGHISWSLTHFFRKEYLCRGIDVEDVRVDVGAGEGKDAAGNIPGNLDDSFFSGLLGNQKVVLTFRRVSSPFFSAAQGTCSLDTPLKTFSCKVKIKDITLEKEAMSRYFPEMDIFKSSFLSIQKVRARGCGLDIQGDVFGKNMSVTAVFRKTVMESSRLPRSVKALSDMVVKTSWQEGQFDCNVAPVTWDFPKGVTGYSCSWDRKRQPAWQMAFTGEKIHVDQAALASLSLARGNAVVETLFDTFRAGRADGVKVSFSSNTFDHIFDPEKMKISGSLENGRVRIPETPYELEKSRGNAVMEKGVLHIFPKQAFLGNTCLKDGDLHIDMLHPTEFPFQGKFELDADISELPAVLSTLLPDTALASEMDKIRFASGRCQGTLFLDYQPDAHWEESLRVWVDVDNMAGTIDYERLGKPLKVDGGKLVYSHEKVCLENFFADIGNHKVRQFSGQVTLGQDYEMTISSGRASLDAPDLIGLLEHVSLLPENTLSLTGGDLDIANLSVNGPFFEPGKWKYRITGRANGLQWESNDAEDSGGVVPSIGNSLSGKFVLEENHLDWNDDRGVQVRAGLQKTPKGMEVSLDSFDLYDLTTTGNLLFFSAPRAAGNGQDLFVDGRVHIESTDQTETSSLFALLLKDQSMIKGRYSLTCDLDGKGSLKNITRQLHGNFGFSSANGTIYRATFLSRILSIINVFHIGEFVKKGFFYNSMEITADIRNGKFFLTHAVIDGKNMVLVFTGWVDPVSDSLDLSCLVAPLKTVDTMIQYIPLAKTIIGKKLFSIPVRIQGNLKDPKITVLHPADLGKGFFRMFEHVITIPVRLFPSSSQEPVSGTLP